MKGFVNICVLAALAATTLCEPAAGTAQIGVGDVTIRGVSLRVAPADPADQLIRPRNAPVILTTKVEDGAGSDVSSDQLFLDAVVRGRLTGNGIDEEISAPLGANLEIGTSTESAGDLAVGSPLLEPGNYTLDDLRLVDSSGSVILDADPSTLTIRVIDRVVVSNLSTRTLSLDEIRERGIVIGDDNFTAFSFTFQLATESDLVNIDFDVVFPQDRDDPTADGGAFPFPPDVPGLDVPSFDVTGIILDTPVKLPGVNVPPIPGVLVVPGNIAFLNQFFEVILMVSNVTPAGSQLVITQAAAELELPLGANGTPDDGDDPLRPAVTEEAQALPALCDPQIDPLLCAALRNTATLEPPFGPGEDAEGLFLVEGMNVGTHRLKVKIKAELQIPGQDSVMLEGTAFGTVLVRHPTLGLSISHPDVVRAGETYSVFVTIHNLDQSAGAVNAACVRLSLDPNRISGATLVGNSHTAPGDPAQCPGAASLGTAFIEGIAPNDAAPADTTSSVLTPGAGGEFRRFVFGSVQVAAGQTLHLTVSADSGSTLDLLDANGAIVATATSTDYDAAVGPSVLGMRQIPEADPLQRGRVVAILFDEAIDPATVNSAEYQLRYLDDGFPAVLGPVTANRMKRTRLLPRGRVLFVSMFSSVSRFFDYTLSVDGFADPAGNPLESGSGAAGAGEPVTFAVVPDFDERIGGIVQGFVRRGDGTAIALARVTLSEFFEEQLSGLPIELVTAVTSTDSDGFYRWTSTTRGM